MIFMLTDMICNDFDQQLCQIPSPCTSEKNGAWMHLCLTHELTGKLVGNAPLILHAILSCRVRGQSSGQ